MRMNEGVEWATHCATVLATLPEGAALPASRLAEFHGVPAPYLAKTLQAMVRAGIVESLTGRGGGYRLGRAPSEITLLEIVESVEGSEPFFRCTEIRKRGPSRVAARSYTPTCGIAAALGRAEQAWREELASTTVADILVGVLTDVPAASIEKTVTWLGTAISTRRAPR
jgi:Rrf2 family protein